MLLKGSKLAEHMPEIQELYQTHLEIEPRGVTHFGRFDGDELQAVASVKCYCGHWYLRGCVVKPEYRGLGLQRALIRERLKHLVMIRKVHLARVSVFPDNIHSIRNIEAAGFIFERKKKLDDDGKILHIYKKHI